MSVRLKAPQHTLIALVYAGLNLALAGQAALAAPEQPKEFYNRDFAAAPGQPGRAKSPQETNSNVASQGSHAGPSGIASTSQRPPGKQRQSVLVHAYISSIDRSHFEAAAASVLRLHDERRATVAAVFHVGDYRSVTPEIESEFARRRIPFAATLLVPPELGIQLSPAWVVITEEGPHLLEGFISISPAINEWGELDPTNLNAEGSEGTLKGF